MLVAHQNPTDLILAILCTDTQLPLTILDQSVMEVGDLTFTFQIIGESHAVRITHNDTFMLQEILACIEIPTTAAAHYHPFSELASHDYTIPNYYTTVTFTSYTTTDPIPTLPAPNLEVRFPAIYGHQPITQIAWEIAENTVRWKTLHLYPSEHDIISVKSVSNYQLP